PFRAKVLHTLAQRIVWYGALADVIWDTAKDLVDHLRGKLSFDQVLRRGGVHVCRAGDRRGMARRLQRVSATQLAGATRPGGLRSQRGEHGGPVMPTGGLQASHLKEG